MWFDGANQYVPDLQWTNLTRMEVNDKEIINKLRLTFLPQFPSIAALFSVFCKPGFSAFLPKHNFLMGNCANTDL